VRETTHQVEVVGDEEERHAHLRLQLVEQGEDLRLDRHVEGSRRLVGDEQARPAGERHRDHRALALAARELVRPGIDTARRLGDPGALEERDRAIARRAAAELLVQPEHLDDLRADRVERIERRHRLLEDHRDLAAADGAHPRLAEPAQVVAVEDDPPRRARAVDEAEHRQRGDRLARARLADEGELLARIDRQRHVVDDRARAEAHRQVLDREQRGQRGDPGDASNGAAVARAAQALGLAGAFSSAWQVERSLALCVGAAHRVSSLPCSRAIAARCAPALFQPCSLAPTFCNERALRS
jgi:hypothetical protein